MDKELIEHITTKLQNHEEPYSPGSWERFAKKEEKRRPFYWPLWSAAAIILICGSVFLNLNGDKKENVLVKNRPQIENKKRSVEDSDPTSQSATDGDLASSINDGVAALGNTKPNINQNLSDNNTVNQELDSGLPDHPKDERLTLQAKNVLSNNITKIDISSASFKSFEISPARKKVEVAKKLTFEDLLAQDSKADQYKKNSKTVASSKWQPGVYVAPSMGNDNKVNMNYGFSLSYDVADKLSINSGIAYSALSSTSLPNAGRSPSSAVADAPASPSSSIAYSDASKSAAKSLESVSANLNGITIPLEIRYSFNNKFYSSVGISAFAVLNSKQQNNYVLNQFENRSVTNDMGVAELRTLVVEKKATEIIPESAADPDKYIGFYNFSLGYKQKISKKNSMSIEPFLRLPMKTFSNENLNLTNGGLRLKIDF